MRALPVFGAIVLSFLDKLTAWWGVSLLALAVVLSFIAYLSAADEEGDVGKAIPFLVISLPAFAAAVLGHFISQGWGALIGGLSVALIMSAVFAVIVTRRGAY
jgi:hypothetical protein